MAVIFQVEFMVKSIQQFFIALLVVMGVSSVAFAADTSAPDKLISSLFEGVNERLKQDADKIAADRNHLIVIGDELLAPYVSFETMSKQILGKNWRKISPDQRKRYTEAFRQKVSFSVVSQYDPTKKYDMEVTGQRLNDKGDRAAVSSVVTDLSNANKLNISYKLFKSRKTNNWQVYDVVVEGVSVLQSFKTASAEDFKRNGIEYMIAQLQNEKDTPESE